MAGWGGAAAILKKLEIDGIAQAKAREEAAKLPYRELRRVAYPRTMGNLPATITIGGTVWTRSATRSGTGTYCYGSGGATTSDLATNPHYTISPTAPSSSEIYNIHYTVPTVATPTSTTRTYYYISTKTWDPLYLAQGNWIALKYMVEKLFFETVWFTSVVTVTH